MRYAIRGTLATAMTLALSGTAFAQSAGAYYSYGQQPVYGQVGSTIAPAATSTYQTPATAQPTTGSTLYPSANSYATQPSTVYTPQAPTTYTPQQVGTTYATSPSSVPSYTSTAPAYTPSASTAAPAATDYTTNSATPYAPQPTYTAPTYGSAPATTYQTPPAQQPNYQTSAPNYQAPAPNYQSATPTYQTPSYTPPTYAQPQAPAPYTPSAPASTAQGIGDTDAWSYNLARFYPAVQACLRKSVTKNPVIANIQERNSKTMMLIGEGGSSNYSTCETGLSGTVVKANTETRNLPPAFFAPLGSTFTVSPDRPFQPIVDTNQKVIGWLVRTQPANAAYGQFGQAPSFDGQFIPPMMVNTAVGKS